MVSVILKNIIKSKGITIYYLSKQTGIKYELLRRVFSGERKLTADEFILILDVAGITIDEIKEQNDVSFCSAGII